VSLITTSQLRWDRKTGPKKQTRIEWSGRCKEVIRTLRDAVTNRSPSRLFGFETCGKRVVG
jgi:hypothetical protein